MEIEETKLIDHEKEIMIKKKAEEKAFELFLKEESKFIETVDSQTRKDLKVRKGDLEKLIKENHPDLLGIMLETSTEKNVEFYTKCGFIVHGSLEDFPPGSIKYYLSKRF